MKLKKFFVDNKEKILNLLKLFFVMVLIGLLTMLSVLIGYNEGSKNYKSSYNEEINKQDINYIEKSSNIEKKNVLSGNIETSESTMITNIVYSTMAEGYLVSVLHINYVSVNYYFTYLEIEVETSLETRFYYTNDSYISNTVGLFSSVIEVDGQYETLTNLHVNIYPDVVISEGGLDNSITNPSLDLLYNANLSIYNEESVLIEGETGLEISFTFDPYIPNPSIGTKLSNFLTAIDDYGLTNMTFLNSIAFNLDVYDIYYDNGYREGYNSGYSSGHYQGYNEGYEAAINELGRNIFTYLNVDNSPILLVLDDTTWIQPDDYDESSLFKHNYLDLQYLRSLYSNTYNRYRIVWNQSNYSLNNLYLSLDNSELNDYNIIVNGKSYIINSTSKLNIESSNLLQYMEFDNSILSSTRLINSSVEYAYGFNTGYNQGYDEGYLEGEVDQEDYYEELIIPSIKDEWYGNGYQEGLAEGRAENNAILKPFELMILGVEPMITVLSSEIAPGITIGTIALIPLAVTMIVFLLKGLVM